MRASRLIHLLLLLQTRGGRTAAELARELEVSVRTIYRDVVALGAAGVPVYTETGPGGGIRLVDGYQTRLTGLTGQEAASLALAGLPGAAGQLGLGAVLAVAQSKIDAALPAELRRRMVRVRDRFLLDAPGWFERNDDVPLLGAIAEAAWADRQIELTYRRSGEAVERSVDPLGLVLKGGAWYLVARAQPSMSVRTYRVDRVVAVSAADETFDRRGVDLAVLWAQAGQSFARDLLHLTVRARVRVDSLTRLSFAMTHVAADAAKRSAGPPDAAGWCDVEIPAESVEVAHSELLRLGDAIEVLEPVELRHRLADTTKSMASLYSVA